MVDQNKYNDLYKEFIGSVKILSENVNVSNENNLDLNKSVKNLSKLMSVMTGIPPAILNSRSTKSLIASSNYKSLGSVAKSNRDLTGAFNDMSGALVESTDRIREVDNHLDLSLSEVGDAISELKGSNQENSGIMSRLIKSTVNVTKQSTVAGFKIATAVGDFAANQIKMNTMQDVQSDWEQMKDSLSKTMALAYGGPVGSYLASMAGHAISDIVGKVKGVFGQGDQEGVYDEGYSEVPQYASGVKKVPGYPGEPVMAIVHGGEKIIPPSNKTYKENTKGIPDGPEGIGIINKQGKQKSVNLPFENPLTTTNDSITNKLDLMIETQRLMILTMQRASYAEMKELVHIAEILNYGNSISNLFTKPISESISTIKDGITGIRFSLKGMFLDLPRFVIKDVFLKAIAKNMLWNLLWKNMIGKVLVRGVIWDKMMYPAIQHTLGKFLSPKNLFTIVKGVFAASVGKTLLSKYGFSLGAKAAAGGVLGGGAAAGGGLLGNLLGPGTMIGNMISPVKNIIANPAAWISKNMIKAFTKLGSAGWSSMKTIGPILWNNPFLAASLAGIGMFKLRSSYKEYAHSIQTKYLIQLQEINENTKATAEALGAEVGKKGFAGRFAGFMKARHPDLYDSYEFIKNRVKGMPGYARTAYGIGKGTASTAMGLGRGVKDLGKFLYDPITNQSKLGSSFNEFGTTGSNILKGISGLFKKGEGNLSNWFFGKKTSTSGSIGGSITNIVDNVKKISENTEVLDIITSRTYEIIDLNRSIERNTDQSAKHTWTITKQLGYFLDMFSSAPRFAKGGDITVPGTPGTPTPLIVEGGEKISFIPPNKQKDAKESVIREYDRNTKNVPKMEVSNINESSDSLVVLKSIDRSLEFIVNNTQKSSEYEKTSSENSKHADKHLKSILKVEKDQYQLSIMQLLKSMALPAIISTAVLTGVGFLTEKIFGSGTTTKIIGGAMDMVTKYPAVTLGGLGAAATLGPLGALYGAMKLGGLGLKAGKWSAKKLFGLGKGAKGVEKTGGLLQGIKGWFGKGAGKAAETAGGAAKSTGTIMDTAQGIGKTAEAAKDVSSTIQGVEKGADALKTVGRGAKQASTIGKGLKSIRKFAKGGKLGLIAGLGAAAYTMYNRETEKPEYKVDDGEGEPFYIDKKTFRVYKTPSNGQPRSEDEPYVQYSKEKFEKLKEDSGEFVDEQAGDSKIFKMAEAGLNYKIGKSVVEGITDRIFGKGGDIAKKGGELLGEGGKVAEIGSLAKASKFSKALKFGGKALKFGGKALGVVGFGITTLLDQLDAAEILGKDPKDITMADRAALLLGSVVNTASFGFIDAGVVNNTVTGVSDWFAGVGKYAKKKSDELDDIEADTLKDGSGSEAYIKRDEKLAKSYEKTLKGAILLDDGRVQLPSNQIVSREFYDSVHKAKYGDLNDPNREVKLGAIADFNQYKNQEVRASDQQLLKTASDQLLYNSDKSVQLYNDYVKLMESLNIKLTSSVDMATESIMEISNIKRSEMERMAVLSEMQEEMLFQKKETEKKTLPDEVVDAKYEEEEQQYSKFKTRLIQMFQDETTYNREEIMGMFKKLPFTEKQVKDELVPFIKQGLGWENGKVVPEGLVVPELTNRDLGKNISSRYRKDTAEIKTNFDMYGVKNPSPESSAFLTQINEYMSKISGEPIGDSINRLEEYAKGKAPEIADNIKYKLGELYQYIPNCTKEAAKEIGKDLRTAKDLVMENTPESRAKALEIIESAVGKAADSVTIPEDYIDKAKEIASEVKTESVEQFDKAKPYIGAISDKAKEIGNTIKSSELYNSATEMSSKAVKSVQEQYEKFKTNINEVKTEESTPNSGFIGPMPPTTSESDAFIEPTTGSKPSVTGTSTIALDIMKSLFPQNIYKAQKSAINLPTKTKSTSSSSDLGSVSSFFESGGKNLISTGKDDPGGQSYGKHQISSKSGTMAEFLNSEFASDYRDIFGSAAPGTPEFNAIYNKIKDDPGFNQAQSDFLYSTHYEPFMNSASKYGIDVNNKAIQEMLYSSGIQHRNTTNKFIRQAVENLGGNVKNSEDFIKEFYNVRSNHIASRTSLNDRIKGSLLNRMDKESKMVLGMNADIPKYHNGGFVTGTPGQDKLVELQSGERVLSLKELAKADALSKFEYESTLTDIVSNLGDIMKKSSESSNSQLGETLTNAVSLMVGGSTMINSSNSSNNNSSSNMGSGNNGSSGGSMDIDLMKIMMGELDTV